MALCNKNIRDSRPLIISGTLPYPSTMVHLARQGDILKSCPRVPKLWKNLLIFHNLEIRPLERLCLPPFFCASCLASCADLSWIWSMLTCTFLHLVLQLILHILGVLSLLQQASLFIINSMMSVLPSNFFKRATPSWGDALLFFFDWLIKENLLFSVSLQICIHHLLCPITWHPLHVVLASSHFSQHFLKNPHPARSQRYFLIGVYWCHRFQLCLLPPLVHQSAVLSSLPAPGASSVWSHEFWTHCDQFGNSTNSLATIDYQKVISLWQRGIITRKLCFFWHVLILHQWDPHSALFVWQLEEDWGPTVPSQWYTMHFGIPISWNTGTKLHGSTGFALF